MMKRWFLLVAVPMFATLAPAQAQNAPADLLSFYPVVARTAGISGEPVLICTSTRQGALKDCQLQSETPAGQGFGEAALRLAEHSQPNTKAKVNELKGTIIRVKFTADPPAISPDLTRPITVVTNPDWIRPPELKRFFPRNATSSSGRVRLHCDVAVNTTVKNCQIIDENPAGQGFGEAALKASKAFRLSPKKVNGEPQEGGTMTTALNFTR